MAIRLSKDLKDKTTTADGNNSTSQGFDILATQGVDYNLDKIVSGKSRNDSAAELLLNLSGNNNKNGSVSIKKEEPRLMMNNADAAKYLFRNEPSTDAYTPSVTLRRPIVIWEEGTPDRNMGNEAESLYDTILKLEDEIKLLKSELASFKHSIVDDITLYNDGDLKCSRDAIPTVGATYDFVKNNIVFTKREDAIIGGLNNQFSVDLFNTEIYAADGSIQNVRFTTDISNDYYTVSLVDKNRNYYNLNLGGV